MKLKVWIAVVLLVVCAAVVVADEPKKEMSAADKAAMEAMVAAGTPGDAHKLLNGMVGTWSAKVTMWNDPSAPPTVSEGSNECRSIMGGRYIEERFTGSMMGQKFEGVGYTGYDNVKKQYWGTWLDSMSTGVMVSTGSTSDGGKTWRFTGSMADPMTGKDTPMEEKIVVTDNDHHTFEMWGPAPPDGKMVKWMEIAYTRKK